VFLLIYYPRFSTRPKKCAFRRNALPTFTQLFPYPTPHLRIHIHLLSELSLPACRGGRALFLYDFCTPPLPRVLQNTASPRGLLRASPPRPLQQADSAQKHHLKRGRASKRPLFSSPFCSSSSSVRQNRTSFAWAKRHLKHPSDYAQARLSPRSLHRAFKAARPRVWGRDPFCQPPLAYVCARLSLLLNTATPFLFPPWKYIVDSVVAPFSARCPLRPCPPASSPQTPSALPNPPPPKSSGGGGPL
jgi:hypothetical protein